MIILLLLLLLLIIIIIIIIIIIGNVDFWGGRKTGEPEKNPRSKDENQQQTQPTYDAGSGNRIGTHWWEASALTTAPSLLPAIVAGYSEIAPKR